MIFFSFDELAVLELRTGADEGDEMGCVDGAPAVLRGHDQLVGHGQTGGLRSRPAGDLGPVPDGGEGGLDRIGNRYERAGARSPICRLGAWRRVAGEYGATVRDEGHREHEVGGQAVLVPWAASPG